MLPTWFWLGMGAALFKSMKSISLKQAAELTDDFTTSWATRLIPLPLFVILSAGLSWPLGIRELTQPVVFPALILEAAMLATVAVLSTRAFRLGDASRIGPLHSMIPLGVIPTSYVFLGEVPTPIAAVGVILVTVGGYTLNLDRGDQPLDPVRYVIRTRPGRLMIGVFVLAAFIPILDKIGATRTSPLTWAFGLHLFSGVFLSVVWWFSEAKVPRETISALWLVAAGAMSGIIWVLQLSGYVLTNVVYIYSLKRVSILLTVSLGGSFFGEADWRRRMVPSVLMATGAIIIGLSI